MRPSASHAIPSFGSTAGVSHLGGSQEDSALIVEVVAVQGRLGHALLRHVSGRDVHGRC